MARGKLRILKLTVTFMLTINMAGFVIISVFYNIHQEAAPFNPLSHPLSAEKIQRTNGTIRQEKNSSVFYNIHQEAAPFNPLSHPLSAEKIQRTNGTIRQEKNSMLVNKLDIKQQDPVVNTVSVRLRNSVCGNLSIPSLEGFQYGWKSLADDETVYVYSAFHDTNKIRIVGATVRGRTNQLYCQRWYHDNATHVTMETSSASVDLIPEGQGLKYTSAFILCPLTGDRVPYGVSIVSGDACGAPRHILPVPLRNVTKVKYSVCVTPFNFRYSRAYELVEWMELNLLLGVNHFTFYNYSSRHNIRKVLEHYSKRGIVDVMTWDLPMRVDTWPHSKYRHEIHYFAQLAFLNDCLYRHVGTSEYLALFDLDEFIIPRRGSDFTWDDMFSGLPSAGVYVFRNTFFRKEWNSTNVQWRQMAEKYNTITLLKLQRETKVFPSHHRSKLIVKPDNVAMLGIHNVWRMKSGNEHTVNPDVGLLHHYRNWENPGDTVSRVWDNTTEKFGGKLLHNVENAWSELAGVEFDIPII